MQNPVPAVFLFQNSHEVRTVTHEGEPWFVAKDIADILGYANSRKAVQDHCKAPRIDGVTFSDSMKRIQKTTIIPERDLYRLIMRSKLPSAEKFEEWVVAEVLPAIRKTGSYTAKPINPAAEPLSTGTAFRETLKALHKQYPFLKADHPRASGTLNHNINTYLAGAIANGKASAVALTEAVNLFAPAYAESLEVQPITVPPAAHIARRAGDIITSIITEGTNEEVLKHVYGYYLSPEDIGVILGISGHSVNDLLCDRGYQVAEATGWKPTENGTAYACNIDLGGYWRNREPRILLKWHNAIIPLLITRNDKSSPRKLKQYNFASPYKLEPFSEIALDALKGKLTWMEPDRQKELSCNIFTLLAHEDARRCER